MEKKLFSLMYDIIGRIKQNGLLDAGISKQDLANKFYNFFVNKIINIRDRLMDYSRFVLEKERKPGMLEFNQVSESNMQKRIGKSKATDCRKDPIASKLIKKFQVYFIPVITTLINLSLRTSTFVKD